MKSRMTFLLALLIILVVPGMGQDQPFYFAMLTDPQFGMYSSNREFSRETANYEFAVAAVNRLKPGFAIILGDLINKQGDPDQIREFKRISSKIDPSIPLYYAAGNHDVGAAPTHDALAAYCENFGRDYYSFKAGPMYGIVLNSSMINAPGKADQDYQTQSAWLEKELKIAKESGLPHIVVFLHHPIFIKEASEPNQYGNMPIERRGPFLDLLKKYGARYVFAGHIHKNSIVKDGGIEMIANAPVGQYFGDAGSGFSLAKATATEIKHQFFDFGHMPDKLEIK